MPADSLQIPDDYDKSVAPLADSQRCDTTAVQLTVLIKMKAKHVLK